MNNIIKSVKSIVKTDELAISDKKIKVLTNLGQIIKQIQDNVPETADKMPIYYVDAQIILDWLTNNTAIEQIPDRVVNNSLVAIDWLEEIPIVNGLPIWERLDCEPITEYRLFKIYRDSINKDGTSRRSFENLKKATNVKVKALYALSKVYHWQMRVKCYDLFKEKVIEDEKRKLIGLMETNHRTAAKKVFEKCMTYLKMLGEKKGLSWTDSKGNLQISPKDMIGWFELAYKLERLSLGLPVDKPVTSEDRIKIDKMINITKTDSKVLNIGKGEGDTNKYLQDLVDIMDEAGVLPKKIEAKGDMQKELKQNR